MGKREQKKQALREQLYAAAVEAFEREGYERVAIDTICAEVGVAKGTFFNHFPSKAAVLADWYGRNVDHSLGGADPTQPAPDPWLGPALAMVEQMRLHPQLWHAKNAAAASDPAMAQAEVSGDLALRGYYRRLIQQLPARSTLTSTAQAELMVALITGTCREWSIEQAAHPAPALAAQRELRQRLSLRIGQLTGLLGLGDS